MSKVKKLYLPLDDVGSCLSGGFLCVLVLDQFDADEEANASHVSHHRVLFAHELDGVEQVVADARRVLPQVVLLDGLHHGQGDGARHRIPSVLKIQGFSQIHSRREAKFKLTVLKYSTPVFWKLSAISRVVITAATGCPLPIGLPRKLIEAFD